MRSTPSENPSGFKFIARFAFCPAARTGSPPDKFATFCNGRRRKSPKRIGIHGFDTIATFATPSGCHITEVWAHGMHISQGGGTELANVTMQGNPVTLLGKEITVGQTAPDFTLVDNDLETVRLADTSGVRI